ncbi:hypothetical protein [Duganella aceris]|uniref:DUF3592 domain-containing protein n=1 Tax=Duganella aceris TaxID=2703883 RepID=A0ABX0FGJ9_9BURK|nr:hypothetical protein [Duganella aceris]NGZ83648.1 hypothetical protein [Duganella aceris]
MKPWFAGERGAYFFLLLGIGLILLFAALEWRFPAEEQLRSASGRVTWNQSTRGALYFAIGADRRQFVLYAKGDAEGRQRQAVLDAVMYPLTVRFDPQRPSRNGYGEGDFHTVYGIAVGGKEVVGLDAVRASYRRDNLIALVMGLIFAAYGGQRVRNASAARAAGGTPPGRRSR